MGRRLLMISVAAALLGGCASNPPKPASLPVEPAYDEAVAASLVFDPPVTIDEPLPDFSRAARQPSAFVGFEDVVATYYYLYVDDQQVSYPGYGLRGGGSSGWGRGAVGADRYERRAVTHRASVTYR